MWGESLSLEPRWKNLQLALQPQHTQTAQSGMHPGRGREGSTSFTRRTAGRRLGPDHIITAVEEIRCNAWENPIRHGASTCRT